MQETQESITKWADETFGEVQTTRRAVVRALEECVELMKCLSLGSADPKAKEECADIFIVMCRVATRLNFTLPRGVNSPVKQFAFEMACEIHFLLGRGLTKLNEERADDAIWSFKVATQWLYSLSMVLGSDLNNDIDIKMAINRARQWDVDGSGHGYHRKEVAGC